MLFLTICLSPTLQKTLRFSSIIPNTVNRTRVHRLDVAGKGINVTRVLTQLGKKAIHLTQLGGTFRPMFLSLCKQDNLSVEWVESESQIRLCYTIITGNNPAVAAQESAGIYAAGNHVTELVEESEPVADITENLLLKKFEALIRIPDLSCVIISGTKTMGFSDALIPQMVRKAKEKGLRVILDIRGKNLIDSLPYRPDIVKPNIFEFASTFAADLVQDNSFIADDTAVRRRIKPAVLDMCNKFGCRVVLTDGTRKIRAAEGDNFFEIDIKPVTTVNNIGSGDAFTAGLATALEDGANFRDAIAEGSRCGALNAGLIKPGVIC